VEGLKTVEDTCINTRSWGMIMGKPRIAIIAAFCCALAAMAARKLNTRLNHQLPRKTIPMKLPVLITGNPRNNANIIKLIVDMISIRNELNNSLDKMK
jgi:hypothetical protein